MCCWLSVSRKTSCSLQVISMFQTVRQFCRLNTVRCFRELAHQPPQCSCTWTASRGISLHSVALAMETASSKTLEEEAVEDKGEKSVEQSTPPQPAAPVPDRYAYFQRGFTSEIYKIEIHNLPEFVGFRVSVWAVL